MDIRIIPRGTWNAGKIPCYVVKQRNNYEMKINEFISKKFYFSRGTEQLALLEAYMWGMNYVFRNNYFINNYRYIYDVKGTPLYIEIDLNNGYIMKCEIEDITSISSYIWYYKDGKAYTQSSIDRTFTEISFLEMKYPHHVDQFSFGFFNKDTLDYRYDNIHLILNNEYIGKLRDYFAHPKMVEVGIQKSIKRKNELIQTTDIPIIDNPTIKKEYSSIELQTDPVNISKKNIRKTHIVKKKIPKLTDSSLFILCSIKPTKTFVQQLKSKYFHVRNKCVNIVRRNSSQIIVLTYGIICIIIAIWIMLYISTKSK